MHVSNREEKQRLGERTGTGSPALLRRMQALGLDADDVDLLFLAPLADMASVDGAVSPAERALVNQLARESGLRPGTRARATLDAWLREPPPGETQDEMLSLLEDVLLALPDDRATMLRRRIAAALERIERVADGLFVPPMRPYHAAGRLLRCQARPTRRGASRACAWPA
jgi:hypothetical protein